MARRPLPDFIHSIARERVSQRLHTGAFNISPFLGALALKTGSDGKLRKDAATVIGKQMSVPERKKLAADPTYLIRWYEGKVGGGKWVGYDDTGAAAAAGKQVDKMRTAGVAWSERADPFEIRNKDILFTDKSDKAIRVASATTESIDLTMEEHCDELSKSIYSGTPSDYDAEWYDNLVGLLEWVDDANNICGIDRALPQNAEFKAQKSVANLTFSYDLIDDIMLTGVDDGAAGTTKPLADIGASGGLIILTNKLYRKAKSEGLTRGAVTLKHGDGLQNGSIVGFKGEYLQYNDHMIYYDPFLTQEKTGVEETMLVLSPEDWSIHLHNTDVMKVNGPTNLRTLTPGQGQRDVHSGEICTTIRQVCHKPKAQFKATEVLA